MLCDDDDDDDDDDEIENDDHVKSGKGLKSPRRQSGGSRSHW